MGKQLIAYVVSLLLTSLIGFAILTVAGFGPVRSSLICAFSIAVVGTFLPPLFKKLFNPSPRK
ncbi:MAG: hypothetical protein K2L74_08695 [Muribaculaceae bacterium]|nr:hypothetical protein [Muribaculaceae bacterium]MDE6542077.1 hypothetical protein [Muribaculaceae bacterium]